MRNVLLIVLDGVGEAKEGPGNAVTLARTPFLEGLYGKHPWTLLHASGNAIGAPEGFAGSSEPGHLTMGAGRVVWQPFEEINRAIEQGTFDDNEAIGKTFDFLAESGGRLHLVGLLSDGGIHSHIDHCFALLEAAQAKGIRDVLIHAIADGRDVAERSVGGYIDNLKLKIENLKKTSDTKAQRSREGSDSSIINHQSSIINLSTLIGRYYAMDRDRNWERTEKAYRLYAHGDGETVDNLDEALEAYFSTAREEVATDYYLPPMKFDATFDGMREGDAVIFWNFRADRAEQLTAAFSGEAFPHFPLKKDVTVPRIFFTCMGPYSPTLPVAFAEKEIKNGLGEWLSKKGVKQLRIAETEKFAHVTFFFNGQVHEAYPGEERIEVLSKKNANYADNPAMSAREITEEVCKAVRKKEYRFILVNYANGDVVGHGGDAQAVVSAMETLDDCLAKAVSEALEHGYTVIITADHGNAEHMLNEDGSPDPSHTDNPVRCTIIGDQRSRLRQPSTPRLQRSGGSGGQAANSDQEIPSSEGDLSPIHLREGRGLSCIAPTVLELMEIEKPEEMGKGVME